MDTLFWNSLNPDIKFKTTKKQFYGQYLWRMEVHANCAHVAFHNDPEHAVEILKYQMLHRGNYGGSWRNPYWHGNSTKYENVDFELLKLIKDVKQTYSSSARVRVEDSSVQFYTKSEDELKTLANILSQHDSHCIDYVTGPQVGTEQLLSSDAIIAPKIPFKYKVLLRDGAYNLPLKAQLLNLLESQPDIKITAGLRHNLKRPYPGIWGAFFYTNDLGITTMLSLMSPGIIGKIHEVVQA